MRRINLYGGPGVGKSTIAAMLYARLKGAGTDVELVQEYVKQRVYEDRKPQGWDYIYAFAHQFEAERRCLQGGVQRIVTDSPLLLQCIYAQEHGCPVAKQLGDITLTFEKEYPSINFFVYRNSPYEEGSRWETSDEAEAMDVTIEETLIRNGIQYYLLNPCDPKSVDLCQDRLEFK